MNRMGYLILGLFLGLCGPVWALRISKPQPIISWDSNTFTLLNNILEDLWNITNGRYSPNATSTDPDGTLKGDKYNIIIYDPTVGSTEICINVDGAKSWDCATLS